jgi:hypothetical protein
MRMQQLQQISEERGRRQSDNKVVTLLSPLSFKLKRVTLLSFIFSIKVKRI